MYVFISVDISILGNIPRLILNFVQFLVWVNFFRKFLLHISLHFNLSWVIGLTDLVQNLQSLSCHIWLWHCRMETLSIPFSKKWGAVVCLFRLAISVKMDETLEWDLTLGHSHVLTSRVDPDIIIGSDHRQGHLTIELKFDKNNQPLSARQSPKLIMITYDEDIIYQEQICNRIGWSSAQTQPKLSWTT